MKALYPALSTCAVALGTDVLTKTWAERALAAGDPVPVVGDLFRLELIYNSGVAFGFFKGGGVPLLVATAAMILVLLGWIVSAVRARTSPPAVWGIGLMLGGALANFADRAADGRVTDFLDVGLGAARWPTFNLADSFIMLGMGAVVLLSMLAGPAAGRDPARAEEAVSGE